MTPRMYFEMITGSDTAQDWQLAFEANEVVMGRDPSATITIPSQTVSRLHASVIFEDGKFVLHDHESRNGTFLNGVRIQQPLPLASGDEIRLGHEIKLMFSTEPAMELSVVGMELTDAGLAVMQVDEQPADPRAQMTPPLLLISIGGEEPTSYCLTSQRMTLGRADDNDIVVNSPIISRYHAEIVWVGEGYQLVPKPEVRNPVLVDGVPSTDPIPLRHGLLMQVGRTEPSIIVVMEVDFPAADTVLPGTSLDASYDTQIPAPSAERTVSRRRAEVASATTLWLPRNPAVSVPSLDESVRSGHLNRTLAEGVECYAYRGDTPPGDLSTRPRGRLFVHRTGMFFLPLGSKKVNYGQLADLGIEVGGFMLDLGLNLIPGGVLIGAVGGLIGNLLKGALHSAIQPKKPVPRTFWFQHPHTFHVPYSGIVRASLVEPDGGPYRRSSARVFCEAVPGTTEAFTLIGTGEGARFFSEMFVAALFVNRFVQERAAVGEQILEDLTGVSEASIQITNRFVTRHGELREEHLQRIAEEIDGYVNRTLAERGYTCDQVNAMTLDSLSHFGDLPRVSTLDAIHRTLTPA